jgi:hypothetical protein
MQLIRKIIFLFAIAISIIIVREFIAIYTDLRNIDEYLGYAFIIFVSLVLIYFALIPVIKILLIPNSFSPTKNQNEVEAMLKKRLKRFETHQLLQNINFKTATSSEQKYKEAVTILEEKANQVRKVYVSKVFYSTSISQNGFLDAIIILSASINIVKEIFIIYNGRVSSKDLFNISRKIYTAVAIGGSEGVEYATDEIIASLAFDGLKSIPFIDKIMSSIAAGFVNAILITRISFIAENYCKLIYIQSDKDLLPSFKVVYDTAKLITSDVRSNIKSSLKNMSTENKENFAKLAVNPTRYVIDKAKIAITPVGSGLEKVIGLFRGGKNT